MARKKETKKKNWSNQFRKTKHVRINIDVINYLKHKAVWSETLSDCIARLLGIPCEQPDNGQEKEKQANERQAKAAT